MHKPILYHAICFGVRVLCLPVLCHEVSMLVRKVTERSLFDFFHPVVSDEILHPPHERTYLADDTSILR